VPCRAEVARVARAVGAGDVGGVQFVGIDGDRSATAAATFVRTTGVRFPVGHDAFLLVSSRIVPQGYPATAFVRPNGRIAALDYGVVSDVQLSAGLSKIKPT
jgi:hypothetical protein